MNENHSSTTRKIIHIDMDAFYASVEQRDNPHLRGKPVAVGGAERRGVVAAASYEARQYGVRSAMASITALKKCPDLIFVPPRFAAYKAVSQHIHEIFTEYTSLIEPLSLDEAYLDVTENNKGIALASDVAFEIRKRIFEETELTASAGISYNKFLAKMASGHRKPNGQFVIPPERGEAFIEALSIEKFYGVGPATAEKMQRLGIHKGADLKERSLYFLRENFGKSGDYFFEIARGIDNRLVEPDRIRKSVGAENTFSKDIFTLEEAKQSLIPIIGKVSSYSARNGVCGKTMTLKVKYDDFERITRSKSVSCNVFKTEEITPHIHMLLEGLFPTQKGIRLLRVSLSTLNTGELPDKDQFYLDLG